MTEKQEKLFNILSDPEVEVIMILNPKCVPFGDNGLSRYTGKIVLEFNKDPYTLAINRTEYNEILPEINAMRAL